MHDSRAMLERSLLVRRRSLLHEAMRDRELRPVHVSEQPERRELPGERGEERHLPERRLQRHRSLLEHRHLHVQLQLPVVLLQRVRRLQRRLRRLTSCGASRVARLPEPISHLLDEPLQRQLHVRMLATVIPRR